MGNETIDNLSTENSSKLNHNPPLSSDDPSVKKEFDRIADALMMKRTTTV